MLHEASDLQSLPYLTYKVQQHQSKGSAEKLETGRYGDGNWFFLTAGPKLAGIHSTPFTTLHLILDSFESTQP